MIENKKPEEKKQEVKAVNAKVFKGRKYHSIYENFYIGKDLIPTKFKGHYKLEKEPCNRFKHAFNLGIIVESK